MTSNQTTLPADTNIVTASLTASGDITALSGTFTNLQTSDPYIIGELWNSDGDCKVSQGNILALTIHLRKQ